MLIIMPCQVGLHTVRPLQRLASWTIAWFPRGPRVPCGAVRSSAQSLVDW
jgi:hypothetical protein